MRSSAFVLACTLGTVACGSRTSLSGFGLDGAGGTVGVGGGPAGSGGTAGAGGTAPSTGGLNPNGGSTSECVPGERLVLVGDRAQCWDCEPGTFSTTYQATTCEPWTVCRWEEREVGAPSPSQDRICAYGNQARQFGTELSDEAFDVAVDERGHVFVTGQTYGALDGPYQGGGDAFVREYTWTGDLVWGRQMLGSADYESGERLALDSDSLCYVLTQRYSFGAYSEIGTVSAYGETIEDAHEGWATDFARSTDASILLARPISQASGIVHAELNERGADGSVLFVTELTSGDWTYPTDLELLDSGEFVVVGSTNGPLFRPSADDYQAFVARFSSAGELIWGIQFGGEGWAHAEALAVDGTGEVYVVGSAGATSDAPGTGMVARVSSSGELVWMTDFAPFGAAAGVTIPTDVAIGPSGVVIVAGSLSPPPVPDDYGNEDALVFRILPDGSLGGGALLGTSADDWANALAIGPDGNVFVVGGTTGSFLDAYGTPDPGSFGGVDAFIYYLPWWLFY